MVVMGDGIPVKKRWKVDFSSKCKNVVSFMKLGEGREAALEEHEPLASPSDLTDTYEGEEEREEDSLIAHRDTNSSFMPEEDSEEELISEEKDVKGMVETELQAKPDAEFSNEPVVDDSEPPLITGIPNQPLPSTTNPDIEIIPDQSPASSPAPAVTAVKLCVKPKLKPKKKVMVTIQTYNSDDDDEPVKMRPQRRSKPSMMDLRDQHRVFNTTSFMKETQQDDEDESPPETRYDYGTAADSVAPDASPTQVVAPQEPVPTRPITSSSEDTEDGLPLSQLVPKKPSPPPKLLEEKLLKKVKNKKKLKKKKNKNKDPNEPQKPVSAYALFFRDIQSGIKAKHPDAQFGEISKIVANKWDILDEEKKSIYKKKTENAKKEYLKKLAAYRANSISSEAPTPAPERSPGYAPASVSGPQLYENTRRPDPASETPPVDYAPGPHIPATDSILSTKPGICVNDGCTNLAIEDTRWDREYCSTECVVQHCREAFQSWVLHRQDYSTMSF